MNETTSPFRVSVVVPSRFHAFDLARELHHKGLLHHLVTSHPAFHARKFGVPARNVCSLWPLLPVSRAIPRLFSGAREYDAYHVWQQTFSGLAARLLRGSDIVHAWSGVAIGSLKWAKRVQAGSVLERSSAHILTQIEILQAEYAALDLPFTVPPAEAIQRDLAEYELADRIAVPSLFVKRTFLARGFSESRLIHAPFGTDLASFVASEQAPDARVFRIVYAGQMSVRKGIHHLVSAFRRAALPNSELVLVGGHGEETPRLLRDLPPNVRVLGHVPQDQLLAVYRDASIFAIASVEEGLAVVQAQALAAGLPLVCTTSTGGEDLLRLSGPASSVGSDGVGEYAAGYVVPPRDPDAMAARFRMLATSPGLLAQKRAATYALRQAGLGWDRYADAVIRGYVELRRAS